MVPTSPAERLRAAVSARLTTDYVFSFWTALGWTLLTCGIFGYYVVYKQFQRSVEHNRRRIEVLDAATTLAWERAQAAGRAEELTPWFQAIGVQIDVLRRQTTEFRDPGIWTVLAVVGGGIAQARGVRVPRPGPGGPRSGRALGRRPVGRPVRLTRHSGGPSPGPRPQDPHNVTGRVLATLGTCGLYVFWWQYDVMVQGNANYMVDWAREDALLLSLGV